ncbi:Ribulose-5-phosphate 4-epimerase-like epimerase or aldolase [Mesorhizobium plurifarium]|uniref:Ribulose-5-phosphate 4-epimerase-like epimerase or aldolase n=1 Tax=Mesorhizobium plurifarium TaxID=69974 RepID=A0A090EAT6_MESPL|nr:Ribulose-5-phosphate 4-epimerase-like epimerase or aldolase [Mesorhizobium plurifarium]
MNPNMAHFSQIKARDLLLLSSARDEAPSGPDAPDRTAWELHSYLHGNVPRARCIMHTHMPYATAWSCQEDSEILPICQNSARFYGNVAYDKDYGGMFVDSEEPARLAGLLGDKDVMLLGGHGVMVVGRSVADAFDTLYHLERACMNLVLAHSTGKQVKRLPHDVAAKTARQWRDYQGFAEAHFRALVSILDKEDPGYRLQPAVAA